MDANLVPEPGTIPPEEFMVKTEEVEEATLQEAGSDLMEAMTPDGQPVAIRFDPKTGQYTTAAGEPVVVQEEEKSAEGEEMAAGEESSAAPTGDLGSLALAAETHSANQTTSSVATQAVQSGMNVQTIRILNPDGSITTPQPQQQQLRVIDSAGEEVKGQQIKILNLDGTITSFDDLNGSSSGQQIRIVKVDNSVGGPAASVANVPKIVPKPILPPGTAQQIKVVNSDGSVSVLPSNVKVIAASNQIQQGISTAGKLRVIQAAPSSISSSDSVNSPVKTMTYSVSQAQQLGILPHTSPNTKGKIQQVIVQRGSTAGSTSGKQQIIRIPTASLQGGGIQPVQVGSKVQYVRIVSNADSKTSNPQPIAMKGTAPIYPKGLQPKGVKITLPQQQSNTPRTILPTPLGGKPDQLGTISIKPAGTSGMLNMMEHFMSKQEDKNKIKTEAEENTFSVALVTSKENQPKAVVDTFEASGVRPRKPCNCTKSQCLKLYCDCFANGEFCFNCHCNNCFNNLNHEEDRQKAIKQCLDRNPSAFKPKIGRKAQDGERRHNKGCNCKRSGCLKNYCECYEAKIPCTDACRCIGCRNIEDESFISKGPDGDGGSSTVKNDGKFITSELVSKPSLKTKLGPSHNQKGLISLSAVANAKKSLIPITQEVVEATCQCLLAQAEESERNEMSEQDAEALILEEFGRCLSQIISICNSSKTTENESSKLPVSSL